MADAEDCVDAAVHLAATVGWTAPHGHPGGSSGGLTALNALAAGEGFSAAAALYGVTDLVGLATSTHDFEARYLDRLVGPLPECRDVYEARSPVRRATQISGSVLLLQGTDDRVVPPAQTERLRDALVAAGRHCDVRFFEGEGHGFRRAETLETCLEEELGFYRRSSASERLGPKVAVRPAGRLCQAVGTPMSTTTSLERRCAEHHVDGP